MLIVSIILIWLYIFHFPLKSKNIKYKAIKRITQFKNQQYKEQSEFSGQNSKFYT